MTCASSNEAAFLSHWQLEIGQHCSVVLILHHPSSTHWCYSFYSFCHLEWWMFIFVSSCYRILWFSNLNVQESSWMYSVVCVHATIGQFQLGHKLVNKHKGLLRVAIETGFLHGINGVPQKFVGVFLAPKAKMSSNFCRRQMWMRDLCKQSVSDKNKPAALITNTCSTVILIVPKSRRVSFRTVAHVWKQLYWHEISGHRVDQLSAYFLLLKNTSCEILSQFQKQLL